VSQRYRREAPRWKSATTVVSMTWQKVSVPLASFKLDLKQIQVVDFWLTASNVAFVIDDGRWN
jgi:hypothetical protein